MITQELIKLIIFGAKKPTIWHYCLIAPLYLYLFLFFFPFLLFPYKINYKNYTVYSTQPIDTHIKDLLDISRISLSQSSISRDIPNQKIFLCESYFYAKLLGLNMHKAFAWNRFNDIFIVKTNIREDYCIRNDVLHNTRPLSEVICHETVHTLQRKQLGWFRMLFTATWKIEGYAEYISKKPVYTTEQMKKQLTILENDHSYAADYLRYTLAVHYLFDQKKYNFNDLINSPLSLQDVLELILKDH